ncbi:glycosyltransferase [Pantoea endophytica]
MNQPPLVSIIITAQIPIWLNEALQSALAQDYTNCEIIIIDHSNEKFVAKCVQPYLKQAGHKINFLTTGAGYYKAAEQAIRTSRGAYVKFMTDAEVLAPDCVNKMLCALVKHPQAVLAVAKRKLISPLGTPLPDNISTAALLSEMSLMDGKDVLRYQTSLNYNLLGELGATLIPRAQLVSLMPKREALFSINGKVHSDVSALALYCKLLPKGDIIWLPESLCAIRESDVYSQPHQRDSKEHVVEQRKRINDFICTSAWFKQMSSPREQISVCLASQPQQRAQKDLRTSQQHHLSLNTLSQWLSTRTLEPFQQQYLDQIGQQLSTPVSLAIIINAAESTAAQLESTLVSVKKFDSALLTLETVVIGLSDEENQSAQNILSNENYIISVNKFISDSQAEWFIFVDAGTIFHLSGLIALSTHLLSTKGMLAVYADEFFFIQGEPAGIAFRPDCNLDMLLSSPKTMSQHWLFQRELLLAAEGLDPTAGQSAELDLILKLIVSQGLNCIGHVAEPLLTAQLKKRDIALDAQLIQRHLHHRGYSDAEIDLDQFHNYRLRYNHSLTPKVSIIILASASLPVLITCVTSLMEKTRYQPYELLIVADNECSAERDAWLDAISTVDPQLIRVLHYGHAFNHGAMANLAASQASGDYLLFLHSELAITDGEWLKLLMNHGQRPEVGIVGGKQLSADNKIRHAGYILGANGAAGDVFRGYDDSQSSAMARLHIDQNYSAVSGDFMLVRQTVFNDLGGFDSQNLLFDDVDLCLRAREIGYLVVWTPYARILRSAGRKSRFNGESPHASAKMKQLEEDKLFKRWMPLIANDPAYNANLSLRSRNFDLGADSRLSWQPTRRDEVPQIFVNHADTAGCGHYRMLKPFAAMEEAGIAQGKNGLTLLNISELAQFQPDSLIIQRRYSPAFHNWIERVGNLSNVFKVFELDDYIIELPEKHNNRKNFNADVKEQLRKSLSFFDRFVVSTEPLAEALSEFHPDIRVVKNCLPVDWWGNLHSLRQQGRKPRVGWAGGSSHQGDLEMIADVVKALANEVEWVFMGMCPDKLRPYVHEFHTGVDISLYPAKLASLDLDLALAPVEDNIFNICKSHLRLMEYGACAIPVICSDVECYRNTDLPVTRVQNRLSDWIEAIRMHLADRDESERVGLELQSRLRQEWMLNRKNVTNWLAAWRP